MNREQGIGNRFSIKMPLYGIRYSGTLGNDIGIESEPLSAADSR